MVALDLPGYGGSEGTYENDGATGVLEALAEFIIGMRRMFFSNTKGARGKVIYVGHDWGCIVGFRLAAEAPALADRFILSNAPHVCVTSLRNHDSILKLTGSSHL